MSTVEFALLIAAVLLVLGPVAVLLRRMPRISGVLYTTASGLCALLAVVGIAGLFNRAWDGGLMLPLGLPWIGAHFQFDALSAFFLVILGLGGAVVSLFAIGYGKHEHEPMRVLAFYPPFLGGMTLVLLAADAFSFLLSWEVMSLLSWALVLTHHQEEDTRTAGYVYLVMAGFGTMALLLAFGLLAGPDGHYVFEAMRGADRSPMVAAVILGLMLIGAGSKAGLVPLHVWFHWPTLRRPATSRP